MFLYLSAVGRPGTRAERSIVKTAPAEDRVGRIGGLVLGYDFSHVR